VSSDGLILRRWDGTAWRPQQQSAVSKHTGNAEPVLAMSPGSPALWAAYGLYGGQPRVTAVRWTGTSWATPTVFPLNTHLTAAVAPSPSSAWLFGAVGVPLNYRYNGKTWAKASVPSFGLGVTGAVATSHRDIWVLGFAPRLFRMAVSHWTGTRWAGQALPAAPQGVDEVIGGGLVASGPASIWGFGYSDPPAQTDWLVHWNGKAWSNVKVPYPVSKTLGGGFIGSDGRNGVWFEAVAAGGSREFLYHDTASGHWSVQPVPTLLGATTTIYGFVPVPGTTMIYAYGAATSLRTGATEGVILRSA
jgi:hypothetical protein